MDWRVCICAYSNDALDVLLKSVLSVISTETDRTLLAEKNIQAVRIVAPSRQRLDAISKSTGAGLELLDKDLDQYNLSTQCRELADGIANSPVSERNTPELIADAQRFLVLDGEYNANGCFTGEDAKANQQAYDRIQKAYQKQIVNNSQIVACTCYMATCHAIMNSEYFDQVVIDEGPACTDAQFVNTFIHQTEVKVSLILSISDRD